jgi:hypothetical protein
MMVFLFGLAAVSLAQAQEKKMYSWTDENGTVHFTDTRPEGQQVQEQIIPEDKSPASTDPYAQAGTSGVSAADQKRTELAEKRQEYEANKATTEAECAAWQAEVDRLEPNRRVFYQNEEGETVRMDDQVRADRVDGLKAQIARKCNN